MSVAGARPVGSANALRPLRRRAQAGLAHHQQLRDARQGSVEQARLERGLRPTPLSRTDAVQCVSKPVDFDEFVAVIKQIDDSFASVVQLSGD